MKKPVLAALLFALLAGPGLSREFPGLSAGGPTGMVLAPSADLIRHNWYAVGLHRGMVKAGYGLFGVAELGFVLPDIFDQPGEEEWHHGTRGFVKLALHPPERLWWVPSVAGGSEKSVEWEDESNYGVATWHIFISDWQVDLNGGWGTGRFNDEPFGGIGILPGKLLGSAMKFMAEYSGHQLAVGARFAISRNMRLDFFLLNEAYPPSATPGEKGEWFVRIDRGFLGASREDVAIRPPKPKKGKSG